MGARTVLGTIAVLGAATVLGGAVLLTQQSGPEQYVPPTTSIPTTTPLWSRDVQSIGPKPTRSPGELDSSYRPGQICKDPGAQIVYRNTVYTCKGPGKLRWRK